MATAIYTTAQANKVKYPLETLIFNGWPFDGTGGNSSLSTGTTPLVNARQWNAKGSPTTRLSVDMLQTTQDTAGKTTLTYSADPSDQVGFGQAPGNTAAARAGVRQSAVQISGVSSILANIVNSNSSATASWQTNVGITARRLTAADKLLAQRDGIQGGGWYALTPAEAQALKNLDMLDDAGNVTDSGMARLKAAVDRGDGPISVERLIQGFYGGRVYQTAPDWYYPDVTSTSTGFAQYSAAMQSATVGRFPVLVGLAVPNADNVKIQIDRDGQSSYLTVYGKAYAQTDDEDWHLFVPATNYLNLNVVEGPSGAGGNTAIRVRVAWVSMSEWLAVLFGRVTSRDELNDPFVFDQALTGFAA